MRLAIVHETIYRFDEPCSRAIQTLRLTPRNTESQLVQRWRIDVSQDCRLSPVEDAFGNLTHTFSIDGPIDELSIVASGDLVTEDTAGVLHATRERLPLMAFQRMTARTTAELAVRDFAETARRESAADLLSTLHLMMGRLHERVTVDPAAPETLPDAVLATERATVTDIAHLFAAAARALDIPTRFVSGWLHPGEDAVATGEHCWIEANLGSGLGWVGFDAVENSCPTERWVRVAGGLDVLDTMPIRGVRTSRGGETVTTRITLREIAAA